MQDLYFSCLILFTIVSSRFLLKYVSEWPSFISLNNTPFYVIPLFCLPIHLEKDIEASLSLTNLNNAAMKKVHTCLFVTLLLISSACAQKWNFQINSNSIFDLSRYFYSGFTRHLNHSTFQHNSSKFYKSSSISVKFCLF